MLMLSKPARRASLKSLKSFAHLMHPAQGRKLRVGKALRTNGESVDTGASIVFETKVFRSARVDFQGRFRAFARDLCH